MKPIKTMAGLQAEIAAARLRVARAGEAHQKLLDSLPMRAAGVAGLWAIQGIVKRATAQKAAPDPAPAPPEAPPASEPTTTNLKTKLLAIGQETALFAIEKLVAALLKK
jgi:hypothetical protein